VVFGAGQYAQGASEGRRLMAHELTHVVQQSHANTNMPCIQRNPDVSIDECKERGPANREDHPLIYNCQEARNFGRSEQERCKRPAVGYAQQKLNKFLQMYDNWIAKKDEEKIACIGDQNLIKTIRQSLKSPQLKPDCWFSNETYKVTKMFQICSGLKGDGKIGENTWPVLESLNGTGPPPSKVPPRKKVPPIPYEKIAIVSTAFSHVTSSAWAYAANRPPYPPNTNKCNLFVHEVLMQAGVPIPMQRRYSLSKFKYVYHPTLAGQWADPTFKIPGWNVVPNGVFGDVAAIAFDYSNATGHVAIVSESGSLTIAANATTVVETDWGFSAGQTPTFRRRGGP